MKNNAHCFKCKKDFIVDTKVKKCPVCKDKLKILGQTLQILTDNGEFKKH